MEQKSYRYVIFILRLSLNLAIINPHATFSWLNSIFMQIHVYALEFEQVVVEWANTLQSKLVYLLFFPVLRVLL